MAKIDQILAYLEIDNQNTISSKFFKNAFSLWTMVGVRVHLAETNLRCVSLLYFNLDIVVFFTCY